MRFDKPATENPTDRKKVIGKATDRYEGKLKATCPFISQVVIHGAERNFVTALVSLEEESMMKWAKEKGLNGKSYTDFAQMSETKAMISPYFEEVNSKLEKCETVKQFAILTKNLSIDEWEMTPTLNVKRKVVENK
jgi:long-chain acyl-CoA synthetase